MRYMLLRVATSRNEAQDQEIPLGHSETSPEGAVLAGAAHCGDAQRQAEAFRAPQNPEPNGHGKAKS